MSWYGDYKPYVPVAQRRAQAAREVAKRLKSGQAIAPVVIEGRTIASTFWGQAWCANLEGYSDFANRLPRGRTYVRNGSVVHLAIEPGRITALVSGSSLYKIQIDIAATPQATWQALKRQCAGKVGTLVELLQGKLSQAVMEQVTDRERGLFPKPQEITMRCSCPDFAGMCKHLAAVMYGVGNRLDASPELLFRLRGVNHAELIAQAIPPAPPQTQGKTSRIAPADLGAIFDIEIAEPPVAPPEPKVRAQPAAQATGKAKASPATQAVARPTAQAKAQPVRKGTAKPTAPAALKPAATKVAQPIAQVKAKPAAKVAAKPVAKPVAKVAAKPAPATRAKPAIKSAAPVQRSPAASKGMTENDSTSREKRTRSRQKPS